MQSFIVILFIILLLTFTYKPDWIPNVHILVNELLLEETPLLVSDYYQH